MFSVPHFLQIREREISDVVPDSEEALVFDSRRFVMTVSNKTAKTTLEPLFHPSIRPNDYGNHAAVSAGFIEHDLAQFHAAFFVGDTLGIPLLEKSHTRITSADGVHNRNLLVHMPRFIPDPANLGHSTAVRASL